MTSQQEADEMLRRWQEMRDEFDIGQWTKAVLDNAIDLDERWQDEFHRDEWDVRELQDIENAEHILRRLAAKIMNHIDQRERAA